MLCGIKIEKQNQCKTCEQQKGLFKKDSKAKLHVTKIFNNEFHCYYIEINMVTTQDYYSLTLIV